MFAVEFVWLRSLELFRIRRLIRDDDDDDDEFPMKRSILAMRRTKMT